MNYTQLAAGRKIGASAWVGLLGENGLYGQKE
jgi:hypothetical protein